MKTPQTLLYFGSFDPFTLGHEMVIQTAIDTLHPQEILIIPAYQEGWGKRLSSFEDRAAMIDLVIDAHREWGGIVRVSAVEKDNQLSGITADTLHFLQAHGYKDQLLGLLMGTDWLVSFPTWEEWEWMLSVAPAFVALRGEETITSILEKLPEEVLEHLQKDVVFLPEDKTARTKHISSTSVRLHVQQTGKTDLVDPGVLAYVQTHHLYAH